MTAPRVTVRECVRPRACCPRCKTVSRQKHSQGWRQFRDLHGVIVRIRYAKFFCDPCQRVFSDCAAGNVDAPPRARYTARVRAIALERLRNGSTLQAVADVLNEQYQIRVPMTTLHDWRREDRP